MGRTESLNLKNDYERACGWYGHFNKSEMALFSECTDRYAQKLLDTADIVREAMFQQLRFLLGAIDAEHLSIFVRKHCVNDFYLKTLEGSAHAECGVQFNCKVW